MKAVIMAGGEGTRLRPLTCLRPKPMVTVANKPVMQHIIELLKKHNVSDIAVTLQYMPQMIKDYFHDGRELDVNLKYYVEDIPLGTAGSVKNAENFLDSTFIVISGDALTDINLSQAIKFHKEKKSLVTLVLKRVDIPLEYGVVVTDTDGKIKKFLEKPSWSEVFSDTANTGIYILEPEIFSFFESGKFFDFSRDLFPMLLKEGRPMYGFVTQDYWCDIGDLKAYTQANMDVINGLVDIEIPYTQASTNIWIGKNVEINQGSNIEGPCIIGDNTIIGENAKVGPESIIGDRVHILHNSSIKRSVILKNSTIGPHAQVRGAIVCEKVNLHEGSNVYENSVIGDNCVLQNNVIVNPNIKIWPEKLIEEGTQICSNIIWGAKSARNIFGSRGVTGEINVDLTPEFASRLASSFAVVSNASLGANKVNNGIGIADDGSASSFMLKSAMYAGLMSLGIPVINLNEQVLPVVRFAVRNLQLNGAIYISSYSEESLDKARIEFLNENGANIDKGVERKIENMFIREDYSRFEGCKIPKLIEYSNIQEDYIDDLLKDISSKNISTTIAFGTNMKTADELISSICTKNNMTIFKPILGESISQFSKKELVTTIRNAVVNKKADIGVVILECGEKIVVIDSEGCILEDEQLNLLMFSLMLKNLNNVVAPITASRNLESMAKINNGKVYRTKTADSEIMKTIFQQEKESAVKQVSFLYDAFFKLLTILDTLNSDTSNIMELLEELPKLHITKKEVYCPWNLKGRVIRELIAQKEAVEEGQEGVRLVGDKGWVLVLPDAEKPMCKIISEAVTTEVADELCLFYEEKVRNIGGLNKG